MAFELQPRLMLLAPDDWPLWRTLRLQALKEAPYAFASRLTHWQGTGDLEIRWRERLTSIPFNLVAFLAAVPIGMVSATELGQDATVELISMWVAPSGRGHGIGDALVEAVIEWAKKRDATCISLDVTEGNLRATNLYLRHGFVDVGKLAPKSPEDGPERRLVRRLAVLAEH